MPRAGATTSSASNPSSQSATLANAFGPDRRVRRRSDFLRIQGASRRVSGPHFVLLVAVQPAVPTGELGARRPSRLGMVVTTKVGNAVARNRIKRVCRSCFRQWKGLVPDGVDLVVIARRGAETLGLADVRAEWARLQPQLRKRAEEALANAPGSAHLAGKPSPDVLPELPANQAKQQS